MAEHRRTGWGGKNTNPAQEKESFCTIPHCAELSPPDGPRWDNPAQRPTQRSGGAVCRCKDKKHRWEQPIYTGSIYRVHALQPATSTAHAQPPLGPCPILSLLLFYFNPCPAVSASMRACVPRGWMVRTLGNQNPKPDPKGQARPKCTKQRCIPQGGK